MKVLVTNGDGIDARGSAVLARGAHADGGEVDA